MNLAALAIERGSEANAPLARAIVEGLIAGEPATPFFLTCLYSVMDKDKPSAPGDPEGTHPEPSVA